MPKTYRHPGTAVFCLLLLALASISACTQHPLPSVSTEPQLSAFEREVWRQINRARTQPQDYAASLEEMKRYYDKKLPPLARRDGQHPDPSMRPLYNAIQFLKSTKPLAALTLSRGLSAAARDHLSDQIQADTLGHVGSDGSTLAERMARYGVWEVGIGETMAHGSSTAQRTAVQLVVDYDNAERQQRSDILNPHFSATGIACGSNHQYRNLCVVTLAGKYLERAKLD